jgi:hypothetical protein
MLNAWRNHISPAGQPSVATDLGLCVPGLLRVCSDQRDVTVIEFVLLSVSGLVKQHLSNPSGIDRSG